MTTDFLSSLPHIGWYVLFLLMLLYALMHVLDGYHSHRLPYPLSIQIKRILAVCVKYPKPVLLVVAGAMSLVVMTSTHLQPSTPALLGTNNNTTFKMDLYLSSLQHKG
jgi:hypothetical protein